MTSYKEKHPLGRVRRPDPRDRGYAFFETSIEGPRALAVHLPSVTLTRAAVSAAMTAERRGWRYHKRGPTLDQGATSRCVLFTMAQIVMTGPVMQNLTQAEKLKLLLARVTPEIRAAAGWREAPRDLDQLLTFGYDWCQRHDEWSGEAYEGTSGRAGAQFFRALGLWPNFWWLNSAEEDVAYLLLHGPIAAGMDWFTGMDKVDGKGYLRVNGIWRGGHQVALDGVKLDKPGRPDLDGDITLHQSWGRKVDGAPYETAKLRLSDWRYLRSQGADAIAVATEVRML